MEKHIIAHYEPYGREPIIRKMKDGTLVCLALTGGNAEPENENVVTITRSRDQGVTWSEPQVLFSHACRGCWSTELFTGTDNNKPFAVVQTYEANSHYRELQTYRSFPDESGEHWTEPETIRGTVNGCSLRQGIVMSNGEVLFPLYWQEVYSDFSFAFGARKAFAMKNWPFVSGVGISGDGETYTRYGDFRADVSLWEPNAVEAEPGHILVYCRSNRGCLFRTESFDFGRTWTPAVLSDLPNPDTKFTLIKVRGKILLINNFRPGSCSGPRTDLGIAQSDDGVHFTHVLDLEPKEEWWFYPHAFADENEQMLYVAYENMKEHRLAKIPYSELGLQ